MTIAVQGTRPDPQPSPLMLADRLLTLARDAERAGLPTAATRLVKLAYAVCDQKPKRAAA